jgi:hypothetical protein
MNQLDRLEVAGDSRTTWTISNALQREKYPRRLGAHFKAPKQLAHLALVAFVALTESVQDHVAPRSIRANQCLETLVRLAAFHASKDCWRWQVNEKEFWEQMARDEQIRKQAAYETDILEPKTRAERRAVASVLKRLRKKHKCVVTTTRKAGAK